MSEQSLSTITLAELCALLEEEMQSRVLIIGIDGCGGSGKSHFAKLLAEQLVDNLPLQTIHFDDFYKPSTQRLPQREAEALIGSDFDWQRLRNQVLVPLSRGESTSYQRYDWKRDGLVEWHPLSPYKLTIVEGIYCTRPELASYYHLTCWVYSNRSLRLARGLERDGESKREVWEKFWMPAEDRYVQGDEPHMRAKLLVDGSGQTNNFALRCELDSLFSTRDHI